MTNSKIELLKFLQAKLQTFSYFSCVWYITAVENLTSILKNGLLSYNSVKQKDLAHIDLSNHSVQDRRERKNIEGHNLHDYVPFYLNPRNAMLYQVYKIPKTPPNIVLLSVMPEVLADSSFIISDRNASADSAQFGWTKEFVDAMPWRRVFSQRWMTQDAESASLKKDNNLKQVMQAELLVLDAVGVDKIGAICCPTEEVREQVANICFSLGKKIPYACIPRLFFAD